MKLLPMLLKDAYKIDHKRQYSEGTQEVYSNFTPRTSRIEDINAVVSFGTQYFVKEYLVKQFNEEFFSKPKEEVVKKYQRRINGILGPNNISMQHIADLHDLGYLPIEVKALPEGTVSPLRVPVLTIKNTLPEFFWLTNFLETLISAVLWHPMTSATIAYQYRKILNKYATETSDMPEFVQWQGHDFSMRGQTSIESALASGAAHLLSFSGSDTIPAVDFLEEYYGANSDQELIGGSVAATEHSVMTLAGKENENEFFDRLITQVYPEGIVSIVSDSYDYWNVLGVIIPNLKEAIMKRNGKVVIRPDSGNPADILCGNFEGGNEIEKIGTVEHLWNVFGGTINSKGFKQLDPHIGVIYGDSITLERANEICYRLQDKGFASTNVVFGIGSYTYQYVTRDTFGFAMKATHGVVNGVSHDIYKDPITDNGVKKSAKGLLRVNENLTLSEQVTPEAERTGMLQTIFRNGVVSNIDTLTNIRARLAKTLE